MESTFGPMNPYYVYYSYVDSYLPSLNRVNRKNYTLALHIDPLINKKLNDAANLGLSAEKCERASGIYLELLNINCDSKDEKGILKLTESAARKAMPFVYSIGGYSLSGYRNQSKASVAYKIRNSRDLNGLLKDLEDSAIKRGYKVLNLTDYSLKVVGIDGLEKRLAKDLQKKLRGGSLPNMLKNLLLGADHLSVQASHIIYRLAILDENGRLVGEFDTARNRWIGSNMARKYAQWELSRFALGSQKVKNSEDEDEFYPCK